MKALLDKTPILASLKLESSRREDAGVFVRIRSAVVLEAALDWSDGAWQSAIAESVRPSLTASHLGVGWLQKAGYQQLDGLWPLVVSTHGKYAVISDDPALMQAVLANFSRKSERKPAELLAGFNHDHERANFARLAGVIDRRNSGALDASQREPQFFSGNMASLSTMFVAVSGERIEIRSEGSRVRQTVTYEWSQ